MLGREVEERQQLLLVVGDLLDRLGNLRAVELGKRLERRLGVVAVLRVVDVLDRLIAKLVQADEDTVRDVIHRFNEIGLACLDPRWAGGRPRLLSPDDEDFVVQTATTRPTKLGQPFTRWSIRKLAACLRHVHGPVIRIGREALLCLLARRGVIFQRTKTWKESPDPERDAKLDRIEYVLEHFPDRAFAFDEFGPLGIRSLCFTPTYPSWANPDRGLLRTAGAVHHR